MDPALETKENTSLNWKSTTPSEESFVFHTHSFSSGTFRDSHIGFKKQTGEKMVVKKMREAVAWERSQWAGDMQCMQKAKEFADKWNTMKKTTKKIVVLPSEIGTVTTAGEEGKFPKGSFVMYESYIEGNYEKWNSNSGWNGDSDLSINAFCHWTYHESGGKLLFCDAQGVRSKKQITCTDPCIMSETPGEYGQSVSKQPLFTSTSSPTSTSLLYISLAFAYLLRCFVRAAKIRTAGAK